MRVRSATHRAVPRQQPASATRTRRAQPLHSRVFGATDIKRHRPHPARPTSNAAGHIRHSASASNAAGHIRHGQRSASNAAGHSRHGRRSAAQRAVFGTACGPAAGGHLDHHPATAVGTVAGRLHRTGGEAGGVVALIGPAATVITVEGHGQTLRRRAQRSLPVSHADTHDVYSRMYDAHFRSPTPARTFTSGLPP